MLMNQTIDQLRALRLSGMAENYQHLSEQGALSSMAPDELVAHLATAEVTYRDQKRYERLIKQSKLRHSNASVEDIDYRASRNLDRSRMLSLATLNWLIACINLIFSGPTGSGKTWLACAMAHQAIRQGHQVLFKRFNRLLEEMELARADGSLPKLRLQLAKPKILILDDFGITPMPGHYMQHLLELVEDRCGEGSLIITSISMARLFG